MATPIISEDTHLPRWAYFFLALMAGIIGITSSYVTAQFFILGLERTESDMLAREALIAAGILMIVVELAAFGLSALLPRERLKALRTRLIVTGVALVAFEIATIYVVQVTLVRSSDSIHQSSVSRIANIEASIEQNRKTAAALIATGTRSSESQYASIRAAGAQSLLEAAGIEQRNVILSVELSRLQAGQTPTLTSVLGEDGMVWYSVARGVLIVGMGLVMFAAAGALLRAGRGVSALPAVTQDSVTVPPAPPSNARRWAVAGVPLAAIPAAAFPAPSMTAPARPAASYSAPLATAPETAPKQVQFPAPIAPNQVQFPAPIAPNQVQFPAPIAPNQVQFPAPIAPNQVQFPAPIAPNQVQFPAPIAPNQVQFPAPIAPNQVQFPAPIAPNQVQSVEEGGEVTPVRAKRTAPRKPRPPVEVGHKMDSGVGPDDGYRYRRIRDAVKSGSLTPSIRAIQAAEGGGTDIVRAYLQEMVRGGVIERTGKGYKLV